MLAGEYVHATKIRVLFRKETEVASVNTDSDPSAFVTSNYFCIYSITRCACVSSW
jgi:hypothetical protein